MASDNPYSAPVSRVADASIVIPEEIHKQIKQAWVAAVVSGCMTLVVVLIAMSGTKILNYSAWELIDVAFVFGMAFGIYKKSRACAVLMFIYFVVSKILLMIETGKPTGVVLAVVFIYFFWQGVIGTFAYRKLIRSEAAAARNTRPTSSENP